MANAPRVPLLDDGDRRALGRILLLWPFFPLTLRSLSLIGERQAAAAGDAPAPTGPVAGWLASFPRGLRAGWMLFSGLGPWASLVLLGLSWQVSGHGPLLWAAGLLVSTAGLSGGLLSLPAWLRMHGEGAGRMPYWRAAFGSVAWPFAGDPGYWRALGRSLAGWLAYLLSDAFLAGVLGTLAGEPLLWAMLLGGLLLPLPLLVAARAAGLWEAENRPVPAGSGRKGRNR